MPTSISLSIQTTYRELLDRRTRNARRRGPKWRQAIDVSLARRAYVAEMMDRV